MIDLLIYLGALAALLLMGYLAACAGGQRWLTLREWIGVSTCSHSKVRLLSIEFDGETLYECDKCGKRIRGAL